MLRSLLDTFFGLCQIQQSDFRAVSHTFLLITPILLGISFTVITRRYFWNIFTEQPRQRWWADIFQAFSTPYVPRRSEGNTSTEVVGEEVISSEGENDPLDTAMSENPVSFVVGDPDNDPTEELEVQDSFPSETNDHGAIQVQQNAMPGLLERRKRLRCNRRNMITLLHVLSFKNTRFLGEFKAQGC